MQIYKKAFNLSSDLVLFFDKTLSILWMNKAFKAFKKEHDIDELADFVPYNLLRNAFDAFLNSHDTYECEFSFRHLYFDVKFSTTEMDDDQFMLVCHSTQHKKTIYELTYVDPITKVGNRTFALKELDEFYEQSALNPDLKMLMLCIGFRNFDRIDYFYSHDVGDRILRHFAQDLQSFKAGNKVFRTSGHGLLLFYKFEEDAFDIDAYVQQVVTIFNKPIQIDEENAIQVLTSIGVVVLPKDAKSTAEALINVNLTNDQSKKLYEKVAVQFYQESFSNKNLTNLTIERRLEDAINNNHLELFYQPKINLAKKQIDGFEALLRWHDPDLGWISPDDFISIAEDTGQIVQIGLWVLKQVCLQSNKWQSQGFNFKLSLNVSIRQLQDPNFFRLFTNIVEETGVDTSLIELEVTESILSESLEEITELFTQIKRLGFSISLDDFGTSYSSLSYLRDLPIDILKIDKSFIKHTCDNAKDMAITKTIVTLSKDLQLQVVAEGVETKEQVSLLESLSCDFIQGFYYYKPLDAKKLESLLTQSLTVK